MVSNAAKEADFLVKLVRDDQLAADESWSRVQATLLILRYSLAAKLIYFAQTINPEIVEPFAVQFDDIMRDAYLKIVDIENVNDAQRLQLSLPLRHGGCGLRSHTANELQRLFVSSALLVAPAVHAATGLHVRPADPAAQDDAEIFCPFEFQLQTSLETLEEQGIARPDFERIGPADASVWADGVAEKFSIKSRQDLDTMFEDLPARERDYHKARIKSCSGVGAQWLAQTPVCHLTQLPDADMCTDIRLRLGMPTLSISICPHINAEGRACGKQCDSEGRHLLTCASGGGFFVGHDKVCAACCQLAAGPDGIPGAVADWKPRVAVWPRATRGAEADIGFYNIPGGRDTYVDAVGSLVNPVTYPGCESTAGHVAELKARQKNADHPVFDPETRRRMHSFDFRAISFERHG